MDKFEQPEREVCKQGLPTVMAASAGIVLVGLLSLWVLKVAAGTIAIRGFRDIVFTGRFVTKRTGLPLLKVFSSEDAKVIVTTIPGQDANPRYRPEIGKAEWALRRHSWNAEWLYDVALAYWQEALRKQGELSKASGITPTDTTAERDRLKQKADRYCAHALYYLDMACAQDPANGFYRRTAAELAEIVLTDPTRKQNYQLMAEKHVPGSACLLLIQADRFKEEGKTEQALQTYSKALSHLKTEFHEELCDNKDKHLGPLYLSRTLKAFEEILKNYEGYQSYIPDDAEIHLRLAEYLQGLYTSGNDEKYAKSAAAERSLGLENGEAMMARDKGKPSALVQYLMAGAYEHRGNLSRCVELTEQAVALEPHQKTWLFSLANRQLAAAENAGIQAAQARTNGKAGVARDLQSKVGQYLTDANESLIKLLTLEPANEQALELRRTIIERRVALSQ